MAASRDITPEDYPKNIRWRATCEWLWREGKAHGAWSTSCGKVSGVYSDEWTGCPFCRRILRRSE